MNIDYNLYRIFLYLYEEKSISKTANKLYVSQPAISYSLKELEQQLGYTLFYRNSKGIEPTIEAKELYGYLSCAFNIIKNAEEHITNLNHLEKGTIHIGVRSYLVVYFLEEVIHNFLIKYPNIHFKISSLYEDDCSKLLENGMIDLLIDVFPFSNTSGIVKKKLCFWNGCFFYNKSNFNSFNLSYDDISNHSVILPSFSSLRGKLDEKLSSSNFEFSNIIESDNVEFIVDFVRKEKYIGFLPYEIIDKLDDKTSFETILFDDKNLIYDICCCYKDEFLNPASKRFVEMLDEKVSVI